MKKFKLLTMCLVLSLVVVLFTGCEETKSERVIREQNEKKLNQATDMMSQTPTPNFNKSIERENIAQRLIQTNNPNMLQWIYPMSAGRVIGRFPLRGKPTSGNKRLTSPQQYVSNASYSGYIEAPDEMGTFGSSGDYIFWYDPSNQIHHHKGDYFYSPIPYVIEKGFGTISSEIDISEEAKRDIYNKQIAESVKSIKVNGGK